MDAVSKISVAPESSVSQTNVEIQSNTAQPTLQAHITQQLVGISLPFQKPGYEAEMLLV
jgi:hypothetical protein